MEILVTCTQNQEWTRKRRSKSTLLPEAEGWVKIKNIKNCHKEIGRVTNGNVECGNLWCIRKCTTFLSLIYVSIILGDLLEPKISSRHVTAKPAQGE